MQNDDARKTKQMCSNFLVITSLLIHDRNAQAMLPVFYNLLNLNFCPPTEASYISPPFCCVYIITPSLYFAFAEAPAVAATADACAENSTLFFLKRSIDSWFSKNINSL